MKINKTDCSNSNYESMKKSDASFEAYFKKVTNDLKKGNRHKVKGIQDCVGSWVEIADFARIGS